MTKTKSYQIKPAANGGFGITRDDLALRTPQKNALVVPVRAVAEAIVSELSGAKQFTISNMPLTSIAFTAIDVAASHPEKMVQAMLAFAETDLLLYRSEGEELAARQRAGWDPVLAWIEKRFDCALSVTDGVMPVEQPAASMQRLQKVLESFDAFTMSAFSVLTQSLGSLVLALAVMHGERDAKTAFRLSRIDEDYQAEKWGEDSVALGRAKEIERDAESAARFLKLVA